MNAPRLPLLFGIAIAAMAAHGASAQVKTVNVAVAANFTGPAREIAALFKQKTGREAVLSFGSSGQFYTQITEGAPFQIMLSADDERPRRLIAEGLGAAGSQFTYAIGKLALWSAQADFVRGEATLKAGAFTKISIADPVAAPYGGAAIEAMKALGVYDALKSRIVQGNSIAQAYQFIETGNAELGFVALSQLAGKTSGSRWLAPQSLYRPIAQDAVLLKAGAANQAATGFLAFLKGPEARAIIEKFGYGIAE